MDSETDDTEEHLGVADDSMALLETLRKASAGGDVDVLREGVRILAQAIMEGQRADRGGQKASVTRSGA